MCHRSKLFFYISLFQTKLHTRRISGHIYRHAGYFSYHQRDRQYAQKQKAIASERERKLAEAEREKIHANLLRAVSHDLRTPLTSIIGSSASYLDDAQNMSEQERMELISNINEDAQWLLNMVENLLSVTKIQNESSKVKKSQEIVEEVVSESIVRLQKRLPKIQIRVSMPEDFLMIPMDATLIEQVLINLMENAYVHSSSSDPIDLLITDQPDCVTFAVRDYGIGLDPDQIPFILTDSTALIPLTDTKESASDCLSAGRSFMLTTA